MKIRLAEAELLFRDGHTERQDEANCPFSANLANVPKDNTKQWFLVYHLLLRSR